MAGITEILHQAVQHQQAGRIDQAQTLCQSVLQADPNHPSALYLVATIAYQSKQFVRAREILERVVSINPDVPQYYNTLGLVLEALGELDLAVKTYARALSIKGDYPQACNNLAIVLHKTGRHVEAAEKCRRALTLDPNFGNAHCTMGFILQHEGKLDEAVESYKKALSLDPNFVEAYNHLALALNAQSHYNEAIDACTQALRLMPNYSEAHNAMGMAFKNLNRFDEAVECYRQAVNLDSGFIEAHYNLANSLQKLGRCDEAIESYNRAIQLKPDFAAAHWNRSFAFLLTGRLTQGWEGYDWRRKPECGVYTYPHKYDKPQWDGKPFVGKRLLVHYEQGLGDCIHFARYLPMVKSLGGTVLFEVPKALVSLLHNFPGIDELIVASAEQKVRAEFDYYCPLLELPRIFKTTLDTIPTSVPYIYANPDKAAKWRQILNVSDFKVGIVWAGSPTHGNDINRSCSVEYFSPLASIDGVKLYSLQKGNAAEQLNLSSFASKVQDLAEYFEDFSDTAAVVANLDLVISVDTAVLHLAGAMAKTVWGILAFAPDWRWMLERTDSPWYPTLTLFRQKQFGNWREVLLNIYERLGKLVSRRC
jgi:tetratricopeptide (TPR) repeat protein